MQAGTQENMSHHVGWHYMRLHSTPMYTHTDARHTRHRHHTFYPPPHLTRRTPKNTTKKASLPTHWLDGATPSPNGPAYASEASAELDTELKFSEQDVRGGERASGRRRPGRNRKSYQHPQQRLTNNDRVNDQMKRGVYWRGRRGGSRGCCEPRWWAARQRRWIH